MCILKVPNITVSPLPRYVWCFLLCPPVRAGGFLILLTLPRRAKCMCRTIGQHYGPSTIATVPTSRVLTDNPACPRITYLPLCLSNPLLSPSGQEESLGTSVFARHLALPKWTVPDIPTASASTLVWHCPQLHCIMCVCKACAKSRPHLDPPYLVARQPGSRPATRSVAPLGYNTPIFADTGRVELTVKDPKLLEHFPQV